jgi:hypothetical protein
MQRRQPLTRPRLFARRQAILYHGMSDGMIPWRNTVNYYQSVVERLGAEAVDENVRLYLVPSMDHCSGGEGPFNVDGHGIDNGQKGARPPLLGRIRRDTRRLRPARLSKLYTRPDYPYPQVAGDKARACLPMREFPVSGPDLTP